MDAETALETTLQDGRSTTLTTRLARCMGVSVISTMIDDLLAEK